MESVPWTDEQRRAIETTGCSVIVSAAAGSGKTAVLAERCAYLVCDAPPDRRCSVDELLVVTFTEAAAAEMRTRIFDYIRGRLASAPADMRLREQLALVDSARISTIHAFCLWIVRRWFTEAGLDPAASVLDEHESRLLRAEVLDELFNALYAAGERDAAARATQQLDEPPAGIAAAGAASAGREASDRLTSLGPQFVALVNDYGLGRDADIRRVVLDLFDFTQSLADPDGWLTEAREFVTGGAENAVLEFAGDMLAEMRAQQAHCQQAARQIRAGDSIGHSYADMIACYAEALGRWIGCLEHPAPIAPLDDAALRTQALSRFDRVCADVRSFAESDGTMNLRTGPRLPKDADPAVRFAREAAKNRCKAIKEGLLQQRLHRRFARFTVPERLADLHRTGPYVAVLTEAVRMFSEAYAHRKRELSVLDFSDLERMAFELLRAPDGADRPSEIARALQRRFVYVLVDEFQDINPVQEAILRLVSRESEPGRADNLFVVGDVKQSIYRFRLAEPEIFTRRLRGLRSPGGSGRAIFLQRNFRSRGAILDAVNLLFRRLMAEGCGPVVYDSEAELRPGRKEEQNAPHQPVELHVIERTGNERGDDDAEDSRVSRRDDPALWSPIEREALLIGSRIEEWMRDGITVADRRLRFGDVAILLRAARVNAEQMAGVLTGMGIPVHTPMGGSLFAAREVRDVLAALRVLDNVQQDIPLAAVLRSGIFGVTLTDEELAAIRCQHRELSFSAAVMAYGEHGPDGQVRNKVIELRRQVERLRRQARRWPLADVLGEVYDRAGFLGHVAGLPAGDRRRANLLKLHDLARQFGAFRRQGLHRFLRFVELLAEQEGDVATATTGGETEDVVRIMSIHRAKGLEFPVVFLAALGTRFNLTDRFGRMIFERRAHIGLRVVEPERMIEYPSIAHTRAAMEIDRTTREEELRVLYVAMTRAREKLVLVGSPRDAGAWRELGRGTERPTSTALELQLAATPLDWLYSALRSAPAESVFHVGDPGGGRRSERTVELHVHSLADLGARHRRPADDACAVAVRKAVAACQPRPADVGERQRPADDSEVEDVRSRLMHVYPYLTATSVPASIAASEFAGTFELAAAAAGTGGRFGDDEFAVPPSRYALDVRGDAVQRGLITHRVLQHLDFAAATDETRLAPELQRLVSTGVVGETALGLLDREGLAWFIGTELAAAIRRAGGDYRREFPYIAAEPLERYDRSAGGVESDRFLVRGIVDGVLLTDGGLQIVEFKTDQVRVDSLPSRVERYRPQVELYGRALARIWRRRVVGARLVFLTPRRIWTLQPLNVPDHV